jgi:hypothetical protein
MVIKSSFRRYVMAVERVEQLLRRTSGALNASGVDYAIIGGNAVAAWVSTVDEGAVRATKDVDLLIRRPELGQAAEALRHLGLVPAETMGVYMFLDESNPNPKTGVHVVFAGEKVRSHYTHPAPDPSDSVETPEGFRLIGLAELVAMKLQAHRFIDRAHIQDLIAVGLIDDKIRNALPGDLRERLDTVTAETDDHRV